MTNYEWLLKENPELVKDCLASGTTIAIDRSGNVNKCKDMDCKDCIIDGPNGLCDKSGKRKWLDEEHNTYTIPLDIPIDTKVLVSENGLVWYKRYFAGFGKNENRPYRAFLDGVSNWSKGENFGIYEWEYCRLAEGSEE